MFVDLDDSTLIQLAAIRRCRESPSRLLGRLIRAEARRHRLPGESALSARQEDAIDAARRAYIAKYGDPLTPKEPKK